MQSSKFNVRDLTFRGVRRFVMAAFGILLIRKGILEHQWLTGILGAVVAAYGFLAPG